MAQHPLFTDHTISVSATLAATLGLEDAIVLTLINQAYSFQPGDLIRFQRDQIRQQLPFWDDITIRNIFSSLIEKGLITLHSPMYPESIDLIVGLAQNQSAPLSSELASSDLISNDLTPGYSNQQTAMPDNPRPPQASAPQHSHTRQPMSNQWQPSQESLQRLEQHGVPPSFAWSQLDAFMLEGKETGPNRNDWNTRFFFFVKSRWVQTQSNSSRSQHFPSNNLRPEPVTFTVTKEEAAPIGHEWEPSRDALSILVRSGINEQFILDAVPEFILYWSERGDALKTWNSKFVQHIRQQWARYQATEKHGGIPLPISPDWQPSPDCFDILSLAHIDVQFARERIAEFVLYWRDSGQVHNSWNSRFLQYIKQQWGKQLPSAQLNTGANHGAGTHQSGAQPGYSTAEASVRRLQDTSWAD